MQALQGRWWDLGAPLKWLGQKGVKRPGDEKVKTEPCPSLDAAPESDPSSQQVLRHEPGLCWVLQSQPLASGSPPSNPEAAPPTPLSSRSVSAGETPIAQVGSEAVFCASNARSAPMEYLPSCPLPVLSLILSSRLFLSAL